MKTVMLMLAFIAVTFSCFSQTEKPEGCGGVHAVPPGSTLQPYGPANTGTVTLPLSGSITIRANFDYNCKLLITNMIIDWFRNDTLIATATPTYNFGIYGYSLLTIATPGKYKTFFKGYYNFPSDPSSTLTVVAAIGTGIDETSAPAPKIYPNPASDQVTIDNAGQEGLVQLVSPSGAVVKELPLQRDKTPVDLRDVPEGIYILRCRLHDGSQWRQRTVVMH